jgi:hypothetical protein
MVMKLRPWISIPVTALLISQSVGCRSTGGPASWYNRACQACSIDKSKSCDCKDPFVEERPAVVTEPAETHVPPEHDASPRPRRALFGKPPAPTEAPESHKPEVAPRAPGRAKVEPFNGQGFDVPDSAIVPAEPPTKGELPDPVEPKDTGTEPPKPAKNLKAPLAPPPPPDDPAESTTLRRHRDMLREQDAELEETRPAAGEQSGAATRRPAQVDEIEEYPFQPGRGPVSFNDSRDNRNELPQYPHAPGAGGAALRGIEHPTADANVEPTRYAENRSAPPERTGKIQSLFDLPTIQPGHTTRSAPSTTLRSRY